MFEQKYCMGTKDGKYRVLWDVSALRRAVEMEENPLPIQICDADALSRENPFRGDPDHAMKTDPCEPCILVELSPGRKKLIDGNHRLYKADRTGQKTIPCYLLPLDAHIRFIVDYDPDIYKKVVNDEMLPDSETP